LGTQLRETRGGEKNKGALEKRQKIRSKKQLNSALQMIRGGIGDVQNTTFKKGGRK